MVQISSVNTLLLHGSAKTLQINRRRYDSAPKRNNTHICHILVFTCEASICCEFVFYLPKSKMRVFSSVWPQVSYPCSS